MYFIEVLKSVFFGIVEGVTEWLPISSTGHMILFDEFVKLKVSPEFLELFLVVIQLGAICAVPILFFDKLFSFGKNRGKEGKKKTLNLWLKVLVGVLPASLIGAFSDDVLDKYFYNYVCVSITLVLYGIVYILIEKTRQNDKIRINSVDDLTYKDALFIGAFQVLSLIPGTSRSGSTILGGMIGGVSRYASAEFSFFMAIPIMIGASFLKLFKFISEGYRTTAFEFLLLVCGTLVSFAVSLVTVKFLVNFVKKHSLKSFGIYRIILGLFLLGYFFITRY